MSHAPFAPSAAKRWMTCPGSFALSLQYPEEPDSPYAAEGSRLHDVAARHLMTPGKAETAKADYDFLKPYLDYARKRILAADVWAVEEHIEHTTLLAGTPDLLLLFEREDLLEVVDLKCGAGIPVDPVENAQAMTYAYMALVKITEDTGRWPGKVRLTIVQPPISDEPQSWDTTADRIWEHGKAAEAAIAQAMAGGAPLVPGDHCRFCRARPSCPALRGEVIEAIGSGLTAVMGPAALSIWLDRADRLDEWITGLRAHAHKVAEELHLQGKGIPGYGLKPKRATRQWADEEAVLAIARRRKIKIWQDKLMSPAMAEKTHPNMPEELTAQIVAVSSGTNLVKLKGEEPQADKAPELDANPMGKLIANFKLLQHR